MRRVAATALTGIGIALLLLVVLNDGHSVQSAHVERLSLASARASDAAIAAKHERWLASGSARRQRLKSQMAFHALSVSAAERLLGRDFGRSLAVAKANPAASLSSTGQIVRYVGNYNAVVRSTHGLELDASSAPLRVARGGSAKPVDLQLAAHKRLFTAVNPVQPVAIGRRSTDGVAVGFQGIRIAPLGASVAGRLYQRSAVFYPSVGVDEDVAITPTLSGAEIFDVLRSRLSPGRMRFRIELPRGAELRNTGAAVDIYKGTSKLAYIPRASAVDAQGRSVPVSMVTRGDELVLTVAHRSGVAYPVLVDPGVLVPTAMKGWTFHSEDGFNGPRPAAVEASGSYPAGARGEWEWVNPYGEARVWNLAFYGIKWTASGESEWMGRVADTAMARNEGWILEDMYGSEESGERAEGPVQNLNGEPYPVTVGLQAVHSGSESCCDVGSASFSIAAMMVTLKLPNGTFRTVNALGGVGEEVPDGDSDGGAPPLGHQCFAGKPVNCATGTEIEKQTDLELGGPKPKLTVNRTYNSTQAVEEHEDGGHGAFGYGWTGAYEAYLTEKNDVATVHEANGSTVSFAYVKRTEEWVTAPWVDATFRQHHAEGSSTYTLPDQTVLNFAEDGELQSEKADGAVVFVEHDADGRIGSVEEDGRRLTYSYNGKGEITQIEDPMGHKVTYAYEQGRLISVTEPGEAGPRWQFGYNAEDELNSVNDGGDVTTTEYDPGHRVISQTDAAGRTRKWSYVNIEDGYGTTITEPNGSKTVEEFNTAGLPIRVTRATGTSLEATTRYDYNGAYELDSMTAPNGDTTEYTSDGDGDRTSERNAEGHETKWTYNSSHYVTSITSPGGETTTIQPNGFGEPTKISRPAPNGDTQVTEYSYRGAWPVSMTNPLGHRWTYEYNSYGDLVAETDPEGNERTFTYDRDSRETSTTSPRGNQPGSESAHFTTTIERDPQGRVTRVIEPLE